MISKILILVALVACEAKIEIPGLEDIQKCSKNEEDCVIANGNKIIKAISTPHEVYNIQGYDPLVLEPFVVPKPTYKLTQYFNLTLTGLGNTKIIKGKLEEENGKKQIRETFEHNFDFHGTAKVVFHIDPEVTHEGPISGSFSGLKSTFVVPIGVVERDNEKFLEIGKESLVLVDMPNAPDMNQEQAAPFLSNPNTKESVEKLKKDPAAYHKDLAQKLVELFHGRFYEAKRGFYSHVPLSDLKKNV